MKIQPELCTTKFSFEVPIKHLDDFHDLQDFIFTLSMLYENEDYRSYIEQVHDEGLKTIWLDNSYNEKMKADPLADLIGLYIKIGANKIIAPDSPKWTTEQIKQAWYNTTLRCGASSTICVVSSREMYIQMARAGATHFAISYWTRKSWQYSDLIRIPRLHFLGLLDPQELITYRPDSCDSSMPVKIAMKNQTLRDWIEDGCPHINTKDLGKHGTDFFNATLSDKQLYLARRNIWELKQIITRGCVVY